MNSMNTSINFEWSPLLIIPSVLLAIGLSYFLYSKSQNFSSKVRNFLFVLRVLTFTLLFILLLNPIIKHFENRIEKAAFVIAVDNSLSVGNYLGNEEQQNLIRKIGDLKKSLEQKNIDVSLISLSEENIENTDSLKFDEKKTDISAMLELVEKNFENRNLSGVLLISDGLFNRGISPQFNQFKFPISSLGIGDTSEFRDIWINNVRYNEVAFVDNYTPVIATIQQNGFENQVIQINLYEGSKRIQQQNLSFGKNESLKNVEFKILAKEEGQKRYRIEIAGFPKQEKTLLNNQRDIYLEIIDGRDKILILALNPHPDIKAIKSALSKSMNYEIVTHFASDRNFPEDKYDLVIMHQIPNLQNLGNGFVQKFVNENTPIWFILGASSDLFSLNREFKGVKLNSRTPQKDEVNAMINPDFKKFKFPEESMNVIEKLPPINVPFAKYELGQGTETVLFQTVSRINTGKPLVAIQSNDRNKYGFIAGDGLWTWRMFEYSINENFEFTDALINKMTQYLSLKEDKRKFRIRLKEERDLFEGSPINFETEVYNDIFEAVYNNEIKLTLKNENNEIKEYSYLNTENKDFQINGLEPGLYTFTASTTIDKKEETLKGQFSIKKMELESLISQADFQFLKNLASKNNGIFTNEFTPDLADKLSNEGNEGLIHSREINVDIISLFWIFFLGLSLISLEWFLRKFSGAY